MVDEKKCYLLKLCKKRQKTNNKTKAEKSRKEKNKAKGEQSKKVSNKFDKVTVKRKDICNLSNLERVY